MDVFMLALVQAELISRPALTARLRQRLERNACWTVTGGRVLGMPVLYGRLVLYNGLAPKRLAGMLERLAGRLVQAGGQRVCVAEPFPETARLYRALRQADCRTLYEALGGEIGVRAAENAGRAAAFFCGHVDKRGEQALLALSGAYRHILVAAERGGENACENLRRRYGVAATPARQDGQVRANFALFLRPPERQVVLGEGCLAFAPDPDDLKQVRGGRRISGARLALRPQENAALPEGFPKAPILSEAVRRAALDPACVQVLTLDTMSESDYNTLETNGRLTAACGGELIIQADGICPLKGSVR